MKAIILAAGRSKRMLPLTKDIPKCLLPIGGKTLLKYQLELLRINGITDIIIVRSKPDIGKINLVRSIHLLNILLRALIGRPP